MVSGGGIGGGASLPLVRLLLLLSVPLFVQQTLTKRRRRRKQTRIYVVAEDEAFGRTGLVDGGDFEARDWRILVSIASFRVCVFLL